MQRLLGVFVLWLFVVTIARAQEPDVATVAAWAQQFLSGVTSLDTEFQQDSWVRVQDHTTTTHGRLRAAQPQRVRLDYTNGGPIIVAQGDDVLWYQPGDGSFPAQYARRTSDAVSAAFSVLVAGATLDHDYAISACARAQTVAGATCIELRPRADGAPFERIRMYVLTDGATRGRPARISVELHDGTWNTFTFGELHVNEAVDADAFAFEPPPGTRLMPSM